MVDLNAPLGRPVPTSRQVLEVIRPQLRLAALIGPVLSVGLNRDKEGACTDGGDDSAEAALVDALEGDAVHSVGQWAGDMAVEPGPTFGMVFCKERLAEFCRSAVLECFNGEPSEAVLDVLALDDGVCEMIAGTLRRLACPAGETGDSAEDRKVYGMAASYYHRV